MIEQIRAAVTLNGGTPASFHEIGTLRELITAYGGTPTKWSVVQLLREAITTVGGTPTKWTQYELLQELVTALGGTPGMSIADNLDIIAITPNDPLAGFDALVHSFSKPASIAAGTLDGSTDSVITTVTPPSTGTMTYLMAVRGTDDIGTLLSRVGFSAFTGRFADGITLTNTGTAGLVDIDGTTYPSGTATRGDIQAALMDGLPHLVTITGIPNTWDELEAGNYAAVAGQHVAGFLAPIAVLAEDGTDYADALAAAEAVYADWVSDLSLWPPTFIDSATASSGTGAATITVDMSAIDIQAGDLILVAAAGTSTSDYAGGVNTAGYTPVAELAATGTWRANMHVAYKIADGTETSVELVGSNYGSQGGNAAQARVYRGVSGLDVAAVTKTVAGNTRPDPDPITPVTADALIAAFGAGGRSGSMAATLASSDLANFDQSAAGTQGIVLGAGDYDAWTSGAFDPAAWTGSTADPGGSNCAVTLALKP